MRDSIRAIRSTLPLRPLGPLRSRAGLLALALLVATATGTAAQRPDDERRSYGRLTEEPGYDRKGDDYTSFRARDLRDCKDACAKDSRCQSYTYDTRNDVCYLKSRINSKVRNDAMITGYREAGSGSGSGDWGGGGSRGLTEEQGYDRKGNDYSSFRSRGLRDCKDSCGRDSRCVAYTYDKRNGACYLKDRINSKVRDAGMVTGYRERPSGGSGGGWEGDGGPGGGGHGELTEEWAHDRKGGDYSSFQARDANECQDACRRDRRCRAYTFDTAANVCYLKDRINSATRSPGKVTGYKSGRY